MIEQMKRDLFNQIHVNMKINNDFTLGKFDKISNTLKVVPVPS